jgi:hypothetical protein
MERKVKRRPANCLLSPDATSITNLNAIQPEQFLIHPRKASVASPFFTENTCRLPDSPLIRRSRLFVCYAKNM